MNEDVLKQSKFDAHLLIMIPNDVSQFLLHIHVVAIFATWVVQTRHLKLRHGGGWW